MAVFVVAHGAWSAGWAWKKMHPILRARGHSLITPTYTGLGERSHLARPDIDLDTHITDICQVLEFEDLKGIILIGHSYGGMVATGVADRARDRIATLIYLDAFVPKDGQALVDLVPEAQRQRMRESAKAGDGWSIEGNPPPEDTSPEDLAWIAKHRRKQSIKCFEQPLGLQAPLTLPRIYIQCMRYASKGPFNPFAERAKTHEGWKFYELDASHSPNVTAPDALMDVLQRALGP